MFQEEGNLPCHRGYVILLLAVGCYRLRGTRGEKLMRLTACESKNINVLKFRYDHEDKYYQKGTQFHVLLFPVYPLRRIFYLLCDSTGKEAMKMSNNVAPNVN